MYPVWWWGYPQAQVQIYLYALPLAQRRKFHGISFSGRLVYPDGEIAIDPSNIIDDFIASVAQTVRQLSGGAIEGPIDLSDHVTAGLTGRRSRGGLARGGRLPASPSGRWSRRGAGAVMPVARSPHPSYERHQKAAGAA